jgi:alpha-beta hydrolase superfamily lysophospholipase
MIVSVAHPEPSPDGGAQLVRDWDPAGPVKADIVLVHGLGEHSGRYARTGSLLAEAGYRVRGFDLLGFGASSGERADIARWSLFLDQVEGALRSMRTEGRPLILMGHSMGGLIALDYALAERPRPDLLILSAPALGGGKRWQRSLAPVLARLFPTLLVPNKITGDQLSRDPKVGQAYFADPLVLAKASARLGAFIFSTQDRLLDSLGGLAVPTLVIHGGQDNLVPTASSEALTAVDGLVRRVFPDLRHETMNEPEGREVVAEIIDWISSKTS